MNHRSVLAMFLVACGGGGADAPVDAPNAPDTPRVDAAPPGPTTRRSGGLSIIDSATQTDFAGSLRLVTAIFQTTVDGACRVEAAGDITTQSPLSAGAITISGGALPTATFQPGAGGVYNGTVAALHYAAGDVITISAAGDDVPAFTGAVTFPSAPLSLTGALPTTLSKATSFTATWTPASVGTVALTVAKPSGPIQRIVFCVFPASAGTGSVPPALLADFAVGDQVSLGAQMLDHKVIMAGDVELSLNAIRTGFVAQSATVAD